MKEQYEIRWVDYYALLQVQPDAEMEVIQAAYKSLMLKYHPDRNRDNDAAEKVKQLNEAREVLSDPARRATYDEAYYAHLETAPHTRPSRRIREARKRLQTEHNPRLERLRKPHLIVYPTEIEFGVCDQGESKMREVHIRISDGQLLVGDLTANRPWIKLSTRELFSKQEIVQIAMDTHKLEPGRRYTGAVMVNTISYGSRVIPIAIEISDQAVSAKYNERYWRRVLTHLEPQSEAEAELIANVSAQLRQKKWRPDSKQLTLIQEMKKRSNGKK